MLTSFLWIAENPVTAHSPSLIVCFLLHNPQSFYLFLAGLWTAARFAVAVFPDEVRTSFVYYICWYHILGWFLFGSYLPQFDSWPSLWWPMDIVSFLAWNVVDFCRCEGVVYEQVCWVVVCCVFSCCPSPPSIVFLTGFRGADVYFFFFSLPQNPPPMGVFLLS